MAVLYWGHVQAHKTFRLGVFAGRPLASGVDYRLASPLLATAADFDAALTAYDRGDYAAALAELRPLAEQGDATAKNSLGVMYDEGHGVPQDYAEAMTWYRKAAEQGYTSAQYNLALCTVRVRACRRIIPRP